MAHVLVIDDEAGLRQVMEVCLRQQGHRVELADTPEAARRKIDTALFDVILCDLRLQNGEEGLDLLRHSRQISPDAAFILVTAHGSLESAVEAIRIGGAADYLIKSADLAAQLTAAMQRVLSTRALKQENRSLRRELGGREAMEMLVGNSPALLYVKETIRTVADTPSTVLILGESGTGKELVARAVHQGSPRASQPMISVNCGAFPETLLESELFGYIKGAFTGAAGNRRGLFEAADGGTLFLDEIGEMSLPMQVSLLRALQERQIRPLGSSQTIPVDVRLIAATNQNLERAVAEGRFREDLFYRISVIPVQVPPLRERKDDIPLLAGHFLRRFAAQMQRPLTHFSTEAMERLVAHDWPGNVRQLENVVERAVATSLRDPVDVPPFPPRQTAPEGTIESVLQALPPLPPGGLEALLEAIERKYLQGAIQQADGVRTHAADLLRMSYRSFRHYAKKYGV